MPIPSEQWSALQTALGADRAKLVDEVLPKLSESDLPGLVEKTESGTTEEKVAAMTLLSHCVHIKGARRRKRPDLNLDAESKKRWIAATKAFFDEQPERTQYRRFAAAVLAQLGVHVA